MLDVDRLEYSFALIRDRGAEFSAIFYRTLFTDYPEVEPLFQQADMQEQGKKLFASLAVVVENLRRPEILASRLRAMGERHVAYGVSANHYPMVGGTMLKSFEEVLEADWTPELKQAWTDAYRAVAEMMVDSAKRPTFQLKLSQTLQGDFQVKGLNLLLVFQVNCPGCFAYALPLAASLHKNYGSRLNILGLSTAFEDFDINTPENTRRLLETGECVGMTKQYLQQNGKSLYPTPILFPIAFDLLEGDGSDSLTERENSLDTLRGIGYTFRANHLQGTPSWILFDESLTIVTQWFGHKPESEVELILNQALGN